MNKPKVSKKLVIAVGAIVAILLGLAGLKNPQPIVELLTTVACEAVIDCTDDALTAPAPAAEPAE